MLRNDVDDLFENGEVGDWCFANGDTVLWLVVPDPKNLVSPGKNHVHLHVTPSEKTPCWEFDGNKEAPTLSPSIRVGSRDDERWHGYLRGGKLISL